MAYFETWVNRDLKKIMTAEDIRGTVFTLDNLGNLIGVRVFSDGRPVELSGSVNGYCILADGTTVPVAGTRSGNEAYIILPQSAYAVPGMIRIAIKLTDGSAITTLAALIGSVSVSRTDNMITPSQQVITDWSQQIAAEMQAVEDASAAQDEKIDDLNSAMCGITKATFLDDWDEGHYYALGSAATSADVNNPSGTSANYASGFFACEEGDIFLVTSVGASGARCFAFLSSASGDNNILERAGSSQSQTGITNYRAVAPANAKYAIFNADVRNTYYVYKLNPTLDYLEDCLTEQGESWT